MKSGGTFHVSFEQPIMNLNSLNAIRNEYESSNIVLVGIDTVGKKPLRKRASYPIFIGGATESEKVTSLTIGDEHSVSAAAYVFAQEHLTVSKYELQIAAVASIIYNKSLRAPKKTSPANKAIVKTAIDANLLEERSGVRLFGYNFLPLDEVLLFCARPYIQGLSGNQKACDVFLSEADIPVTKMRSPMSSLNKLEIQDFTQHLTSKLLEKGGPSIIPFGTDYILTKEGESSPLRYLSGLEAIADTAWARQELGAAMSIWIGDRGRALRTMIDTYLSHSKDVISTVQRIETTMKVTSNETSTMIDVLGIRKELLTDVGRVALQAGIVDPGRPLAISNEECSVIIWTHKNIVVNQIIPDLERQNLSPKSTSPQSLKFENIDNDTRTEILMMVANRTKRRR
ncbi:MAG: hypothetical protein ACFFCP_02525 [Promethearchaeota archaeon]